MERAYSRINWENEPSINTPINDINLNKMDAAIYTIDGRVVGFDTTKANQSDLLLSIKNVDYNTTTGVFTFTWQNGTTKVIDLNIEKIPVSFSMDEHGVITMTTADGTQYTADVGALIKTYTFADSTVIDFTVTTDASGNKTVTANIVDGSITDNKMQPNYLADITAQASAAAVSASDSEEEALVSEGFAVGEQNGVPVTSDSPYYHNNAKYYSEQSGTSTLTALDDVDINNPQENDALVYNPITQKWENKEVQGGGGGTWGSITGDISDQTDLQNALDLKADSSDLNNKVNKDAVTESWNSSKTYSVGEYCVYNNSIWKCLVQNSGQTPIEGTYWTLITIMGEVAELNTNLVAENNQNFKFGFQNSKYGYWVKEADTDVFVPFKKGYTELSYQQGSGSINTIEANIYPNPELDFSNSMAHADVYLKLDLTDIASMTFTIGPRSGESGNKNINIFVRDTRDGANIYTFTVACSSSSNSTHTIDLSSYSGNKYLVFHDTRTSGWSPVISKNSISLASN